MIKTRKNDKIKTLIALLLTMGLLISCGKEELPETVQQVKENTASAGNAEPVTQSVTKAVPTPASTVAAIDIVEEPDATVAPVVTEKITPVADATEAPKKPEIPEKTEAEATATPTTKLAPTPLPTSTPAPLPTAVPTPKLELTVNDPNDKNAPFFLSFQSNVTIAKGKSFDVHNYLSYIDDVDSDVDFYVSGQVDTSKCGSYELKVTICDDGGNTASNSMTVNVVESIPGGGGGGLTSIDFSDFKKKYQGDNISFGIDVSKWQGDIDFKKVRDAGCEFVIIRLGGYSGSLFTDSYFKSNIKNARDAGLKVGIYWYTEENSVSQVRSDMKYLFDVLDGESLDLPIAFDWEDYLHFENYKMSIKDLNDIYTAFREEVEARGYSACLYNSKYYLGLLWNEANKSSVWLAHYVNQTDYSGNYFMWQQGIGKIDGIAGDADLDILYTNRM